MAATAALLGTLLCTNADITFYTQQQIFWANKYEANAAKLGEQQTLEEKYWDAYDKCYYADAEHQVKIGSQEFTCNCECSAIEYANLKVKNFDEELLDELMELDIQYETMKLMYETQLEALRAQQESEKTATSTAAQDTGLLGG